MPTYTCPEYSERSYIEWSPVKPFVMNCGSCVHYTGKCDIIGKILSRQEILYAERDAETSLSILWE